MTPNPHDVALAKAQIEISRQRLFGTLAQLQDRLKPANLAHDAVDSAAQGVASAARKGADVVRARPLAAAGVAGAIGLFLARGWIGNIVRGKDETSGAPVGLKTERAPRATTKRAPRATKGSTK
jgi:ElaB/YqjD/DUF883 family membrane-anchored ribosome-binding protein